jgi:hypothetical protein
MTAGLNDDNREEWQIVDPDDANGVLGWRLTLVDESKAFSLQAHDESGDVAESFLIEPYLLSAWALTFKQAATHEEREPAQTGELRWQRVINPFEEDTAVEYSMQRVEGGLYELGGRVDGDLVERVQIEAANLLAFPAAFEEAQDYFREWVGGESDPMP